MTILQYWEEAIFCSLDEVGIPATPEQITQIAKNIETSHENYGMAFYSPPSSDRISDINKEWEKKYKDLEKDFDKYKINAIKAVGQALGQRNDARIGIGEYGEVFRYDGRTTQIQ